MYEYCCRHGSPNNDVIHYCTVNSTNFSIETGKQDTNQEMQN